MAVWFPLNNPIKPCSVLDKICWDTATTNIKITESYLSLKRQMWKTEHFLFRWTLSVLTQIYSETKVYTEIVCHKEYENFYKDNPFLHIYLPEMLRLILKENLFHFNGMHYLQNRGTAMGTKTAVLIPLPIFSWHILKQQLWAELSLQQQFGNATYTISRLYCRWEWRMIIAVTFPI